MARFRWPNPSWRMRFIQKTKRPESQADVGRCLVAPTVSGHQGCDCTAQTQESGTLKCCRVLLDFSWHPEAHGSDMDYRWVSQISWDVLDGNRCLHKDTGLSAGSPSGNSSSAFSSSTHTHRHQGERALIHEPDPILRIFIVLQITSKVPLVLM